MTLTVLTGGARSGKSAAAVAADAAYLVVAGRMLPLVDPADGLGLRGRGE